VKRTIAFVSFALLAALAAVGAGAAPMATGIQYDEINRMLPASATAPPPGAFGSDAASIESPPPDKKKHGLIGALMSGQLIEPNAAALNPFADLLQGKLERYSYYGSWERVDDVLAKSATIRKCDLHQVIELDLDKKTYRIIDTTPKADSAPSPVPAPSHHATPAPGQAPGTGILEVTRAVRALGAVLIDGLTAQHFQSSDTIVMTQASGSCRDGTYAVARDAYLSGFAQPHAICPVDFHGPATAYPYQPEQMVAHGGCRPTIATHVSGPQEPADKLALYSLMSLSASNAAQSKSSPAAFSFLTERGNVRALSAVDRTLFDIPSDYTKVP